MNIPDYVGTLLEKLDKSGYDSYIVGGCVRDSLLGKVPHDFDITTSAKPAQTEEALCSYKIIETGIVHGTVTVLSDSKSVEITTFRIDGQYKDNRHPENVVFTSDLREDLSRRDFTVNAMAYNEEKGLVDLFGGQSDLEKRIIRAVGNPDERFTEDALRIMRALRFAAVYGFSIEKNTADAIHRHKDLLNNIAGERIAVELNKLICAQCADIIREFSDVFSVIIPELAATIGFEQHNKYHNRTVFEHTLATIEAAPNDVVLRLTMLFHDLGKPACFTLTDGVGHCKGHADVSTEIASRTLNRLRYDNMTKGRIITLVKHHDIPLEDNTRIIKRRLNRFGEDTFFRLVAVHIADNMGKAEYLSFRNELFMNVKKSAERIINESECFSLKQLAVNGGDMLRLGYRGENIGNALHFLLEAVIEEKCENNHDDLIKYLEMYKKM